MGSRRQGARAWKPMQLPKRILKSTDEANSPHRILVRSLLKSRNKLREKYRKLEPNAKGGGTKPPRLSGHGVPGAKRAGWHTKHVPKRIKPGESNLGPTATTPGAIGATRSGIGRVARGIGRLGRGGKKGVVNRLADCARERIHGPWPVQSTCLRNTQRLLISRGQSTANQSASHSSWGRRSLRAPP